MQGFVEFFAFFLLLTTVLCLVSGALFWGARIFLQQEPWKSHGWRRGRPKTQRGRQYEPYTVSTREIDQTDDNKNGRDEEEQEKV